MKNLKEQLEKYGRVDKCQFTKNKKSFFVKISQGFRIQDYEEVIKLIKDSTGMRIKKQTAMDNCFEVEMMDR